MKVRGLLAVVLVIVLSGCVGLGVTPEVPTPTVQASPTAGLPTQTAAPQATSTLPGPLTLRVWVPPQFDPAGNTPAGQVLKARLQEFHASRTDVRVQVRVKAVEGQGGLIDALTTASAAAPAALPDLVAIPRPLLEAAALKGLLYSFDAQQTSLGQADWFFYAQEMARLQNSAFGLPFAGDALAVIYRESEIEQPPASWEDALALDAVLAYAAADPQAIFTLAQYQASEGEVRDQEGRPILQVEPLARVLGFYQQAAASGLMPVALAQYQTQEQAWAAFVGEQAQMAVVWSSFYLAQALEGAALAPLPTADGDPFTLAQGWLWALATPDPNRQPQAAELAEFLTESKFIGDLAEAAGYLPTRPSAVQYWGDANLRLVIEQVLASARLAPASDVINTLGMPLEEATVLILKQQSDPNTAAQEAAASLRGP